MQHVNDDMDELFRRAAENYPLETGGADWNKVWAAMQGQNVPDTSKKNQDKKGRFLWLLLLLPLGLICNRLYSPEPAVDTGLSETGAAEKRLPSHASDKLKNPNEKNTNDVSIDHTTTLQTAPTPTNKFELTDLQKTNVGFSSSNGETKKRQFTSSSNGLTHNNKSATTYSRNFSNQTERHVEAMNDPDSEESESYRKFLSEILFVRELTAKPGMVFSRDLSPLKNPNEQSSKQAQSGKRQKRFYGGVMAGLDITTIKFQKVENKGHDYGLLLGYELNKKWSLESGVYLSSKYYYTDGKYLNTSKIYLPPNAWIDEASGDCEMIEVPISVRYNFTSNKRSGWFATAGMSSYFMKEEKYTYQYYYGTYGPVPHDRQYKNSSNNLFSNISLSGGYTHKLGKIANLRIEPYLKVPVSGMGIAKLPLLSTGIHVGITKKF